MDENLIFEVKGAKFYLPQHDVDCIQSLLAHCHIYWDTKAHSIINRYLKDNAVILDIGANIGSHSIYWARERNAKKVYAFEPLKFVYDILEKNVELNSLQNIITTYNFGLSDIETNAKNSAVCMKNIGGTSFRKDANGDSFLKPLDYCKFQENIDLIKIDVEGAEVEVLNGAISTLVYNKPILVIETFNKKAQVEEILSNINYKLVDTIREGEDYIFMPE